MAEPLAALRKHHRSQDDRHLWEAFELAGVEFSKATACDTWRSSPPQALKTLATLGKVASRLSSFDISSAMSRGGAGPAPTNRLIRAMRRFQALAAVGAAYIVITTRLAGVASSGVHFVPACSAPRHCRQIET